MSGKNNLAKSQENEAPGAKKYVVRHEEFKNFKRCYFGASKALFLTHDVFIKVWPRIIAENGQFDAIVSDEPPKSLKPWNVPKDGRSRNADEEAVSTRKDTLWGDLKLGAKILSRTANHNKGLWGSLKDRINDGWFIGNFQVDKNTEALIVGQPIYLKVKPRKGFFSSNIQASIVPAAILDNADRFSNLLKWLGRNHRKTQFAVFLLCVASVFGAYQCAVTFTGKAPVLSIAEKKLIEAENKLNMKIEARNLELNAALKKFSATIEGQSDIGVLMENASVTSDGNLHINLRSDWERVGPASISSGFTSICKMWRDLSKNSKADVELIETIKLEKPAKVWGAPQYSYRRPFGSCGAPLEL